jgi:hypothetical protein
MTKIFNRWRKGEAHAAPISAYNGPVKRLRASRNVYATIALPDGMGVDDLTANKAGATLLQKIEAAAHWPPGTMTVSPNMDNARYADVILSDPRILRKPVHWEGPSWTNGASIADSISIGMYQDGTECEVEVPATQIQVMGQVGSGKSLGGAWNALGEMITRHDCVVWAIDIKKGLQTLGPLVPGLHRVAITPADAIDLLRDANNLITPRTNYLSSDGLGKWSRGSGIKYLVVWIEEAPYVMNELGSKGKQIWLETVKAARSAGITIAWSLQRAGFTEISTIARGQATKWCFGVQDSREAKFGLSEIQKDRGCNPEMWGQRRPGMSFIDAPNILESKVGMPLRAWWWGNNDSLIKKHSAQYPWEDRPYDDLMQEYFKAKEKGEVIIGTLPIYKRPIDESIEPVLTEPIKNVKPVPAATPASLNKRERGEIGRKIFATIIDAKRGETVSKHDFKELQESMGLTDRWIYIQLDKLVSDGLAIRKKKGEGMGRKPVTWELKPK